MSQVIKSGSKIQIDTEKIAEFARRISLCKKEIQQTHEKLEALSHQDVSIWTDESGASLFRGVFAEDMRLLHQEARRLEACLRLFEESVRKAHGAMMTADEDANLALEISKSMLAKPEPKVNPNSILFGGGRRVGSPRVGVMAE